MGKKWQVNESRVLALGRGRARGKGIISSRDGGQPPRSLGVFKLVFYPGPGPGRAKPDK